MFGTKCATVPHRSETKDYLYIHALIYKAQIDLPEGIACAAAIDRRQYNPVLTLQAPSHFKDLATPLPQRIRAELLAAVKAVSLQHLPVITASQTIGESILDAIHE